MLGSSFSALMLYPYGRMIETCSQPSWLCDSRVVLLNEEIPNWLHLKKKARHSCSFRYEVSGIDSMIPEDP